MLPSSLFARIIWTLSKINFKEQYKDLRLFYTGNKPSS